MNIDRKFLIDSLIVIFTASVFSLGICYLILFRMFNGGFSENEVTLFLIIPFTIFAFIFPIIGVGLTKFMRVSLLPEQINKKSIWLLIIFVGTILSLMLFDLVIYQVNTDVFYQLGNAFDKLSGVKDAGKSIGTLPMFFQGIFQNILGVFIGVLILNRAFKLNKNVE